MGNLRNFMDPLLSNNHAAFATAVSKNDFDSIALVEKAADKIKKLYEDQGIDTFDVLGLTCAIFSGAYDIAERRLRSKMKEAMDEPSNPENDAWLKANYPKLSHRSELMGITAQYIQKAVHFNDIAIEWAKKYLPQTKQFLEIFEEMAKPLRSKAGTY